MTRTRILQGIAGGALVLLGLGGLVSVGSSPAAAGAEGDSHETMHAMMDAMGGEGTAERMHEVEGVEKMMDQCAGMMDAMGGMSNMMNGRGTMGGNMDGMMRGGMMGGR